MRPVVGSRRQQMRKGQTAVSRKPNVDRGNADAVCGRPRDVPREGLTASACHGGRRIQRRDSERRTGVDDGQRDVVPVNASLLVSRGRSKIQRSVGRGKLLALCRRSAENVTELRKNASKRS